MHEYSAVSGNVTLIQTAPSIAGSFDITFEAGAGSLSGTFNATDSR